MKLISLNIWGGVAYEPLMEFIKNHAPSVDIFCFQEVFQSSLKGKVHEKLHADIYDDLVKILKDFNVHYEWVQEKFGFNGPVDFDLKFGQANFFKKSINTTGTFHEFIAGSRNSADPANKNSTPGGMLCNSISSNGKTYMICNVHGIAYPGTKIDTPERLEQSEKIKNVLEKSGYENAVLCGDFNLMPQTQSIKTLEEHMVNLISKYDVKNTRSRLSPYYGTPEQQNFADFTFVGPSIKVNHFEVLDDQVSDHLAMFLDFA